MGERPATLEELLAENQQLRNQMAQLELLYRTSPVGSCLVDPDLRYLRINDRLAEINGRSVADHIGRRVGDVIPQIREQVEGAYRRVLETHEPVIDVEVIGVSPTYPDTELTCIVSHYPFFSDAGEVLGVRTVVLDVTEVKAAREAQRVAEARYQDLYENAPDMFISVDVMTDQIVQCNRTFAEVTGFSKHEVVGHPHIDIYHPGCHDRVEKTFERFRREGSLSNAELEIRRKDGGKIPVILNVSAVRGPDGQILRSRSVLRDVSDRKETEEALERSEALVRAMFDSALDAIIAIDHEGRVIDFNPAAETIFGLRREETIGKPLADLIIPPALRERCMEGFARHLRDGKSDVLGERLELSGLRAGGAEFPVELTIGRLDMTGPPRFVGFLRDITERKRLEKDVLDTSIQEQQRIARDLHDGLGQELFGTALLARKARLRLSEKEAPEAETLSQITDLLQAAIGTTRSVVDGLYPLQVRTGGLKSALERMVVDISRVHEVSCRLEWDGDAPTLDDDAIMHMYYIAREAVTNAARHSGSQNILVTIRTDQTRMTLAVEDDGIGMPPEPPAGETGSRGLRIMKYRAHLIGGALEIRGNVKPGTRVTCTIDTAGSSR